MNLSQILFLILFFLSPSLQAESPFEARLKNYSLKEQISAQKDSDGERVLPQFEDFSLASDLILWKYWPDTTGYYHGPGFWLDTYMEYRPLPGLSVNGKLIFVNGSSSYGYNAASGTKPFVGVTWAPEFEMSDWKLLIRFFDLDRVTVASGLFFEDREMSGAYVSLQNRSWFLKLRLPGTGVLNVTGDVYSLESYFDTGIGDLGLHSFYIAKFAQLEPVSNGGALDIAFYNIPPVTSLFFRNDKNSSFLYRFEMANREDQWAGLAGLGYAFKNKCWFCFETFIQARQYDEDIVAELGGKASFEYMPLTLHTRDYHNAINILRERGRAQSASLNLNFKIQLSDRFFIESLNEIGAIQYKANEVFEDKFYWYRQNFAFCPYANRPRSCAKFFVANKVLLVNGLERTFFQDSNIHKRADIFGFEAQIML